MVPFRNEEKHKEACFFLREVGSYTKSKYKNANHVCIDFYHDLKTDGFDVRPRTDGELHLTINQEIYVAHLEPEAWWFVNPYTMDFHYWCPAAFRDWKRRNQVTCPDPEAHGQFLNELDARLLAGRLWSDAAINAGPDQFR